MPALTALDARLTEILCAIVDEYEAQPPERRQPLLHLRYGGGRQGFNGWGPERPRSAKPTSTSCTISASSISTTRARATTTSGRRGRVETACAVGRPTLPVRGYRPTGRRPNREKERGRDHGGPGRSRECARRARRVKEHRCAAAAPALTGCPVDPAARAGLLALTFRRRGLRNSTGANCVVVAATSLSPTAAAALALAAGRRRRCIRSAGRSIDCRRARAASVGTLIAWRCR